MVENGGFIATRGMLREDASPRTDLSSIMNMAGDRIKESFESLKRFGVRFCVLRGFDTLPERIEGSDIDCVCHPSDQNRLHEAMSSIGFLRVFHRQHPREVVFYSSLRNGEWLAFSFAFKLIPAKFHVMSGIEDFIERRRDERCFCIPAPPDEFTQLFLHCVLKSRWKEVHIERLRKLADMAADQVKANLLGFGLDLEKITAALSARDIVLLNSHLATVKKMFPGWKWREHFFNIRRKTGIHFLLPSGTGRGRALRVAFMGLDGSGKTTMIGIMRNIFQDSIFKPGASFAYLGGHKNQSPVFYRSFSMLKRVLPEKWHLAMHAIQLFLHKKAVLSRAKAGSPDICFWDRSFCDTLVKNDIRPAQRLTGAKIKLYNLLFNQMAPQPDIIIWLDITPELSLRRKGEHTADYLARKKEIYLEWLELAPRVYRLDASLPAPDLANTAAELTLRNISI